MPSSRRWPTRGSCCATDGRSSRRWRRSDDLRPADGVREIRASWQRLLFFFVCIAIGVGSIVALRSVIQSVRVALWPEKRGRSWAPTSRCTTNRPWTRRGPRDARAEERAGRVTLRSEAAEIPTMVRPADPLKVATRMVELRAVGPEFPLYGVVDAPRRRLRARAAGRVAARSSGRSCWRSSAWRSATAS